MNWCNEECYKCGEKIVVLRTQTNSRSLPICVPCDTPKPFVKIAWCCGHPMFWSEQEDQLRCVVRHCPGYMANPNHNVLRNYRFQP